MSLRTYLIDRSWWCCAILCTLVNRGQCCVPNRCVNCTLGITWQHLQKKISTGDVSDVSLHIDNCEKNAHSFRFCMIIFI